MPIASGTKKWRRFLATVSEACVTGLMLIMWLDVVVEDSGNYTCEIRGPMSMALAHVTHQLYVRGRQLGWYRNSFTIRYVLRKSCFILRVNFLS